MRGLWEHLRKAEDVMLSYTKDKDHPWDRDRTEKYIRFMIAKGFRRLDCFHGAAIEKSTNRLIGMDYLGVRKFHEHEDSFYYIANPNR